MEIKEIGAYAQKINDNISRVLIGKKDEIDLILVSLFAGGHALLDDVPGTGKTVLAKSLAKSIQCDFKRIQFTADLLPSDITGLSVYNQKTGEFDFQPGPAFTNILLADEINRTTPRTQSALLECMEEKQITVDGETKPLGAPFFVIATQNPVESSGTFALPEAQLDRFLVRLTLGYPSTKESVVSSPITLAVLLWCSWTRLLQARRSPPFSPPFPACWCPIPLRSISLPWWKPPVRTMMWSWAFLPAVCCPCSVLARPTPPFMAGIMCCRTMSRPWLCLYSPIV